MKQRIALLFLLIIGVSANAAEVAKAGRLTFHSNFWINLHERLRHDALTKAASELPAQALAIYEKEVAPKQPFLDPQLIKLQESLALASDDALPNGIPPAIAEALRLAAPVYRAKQWKADDAVNRFWIAMAVRLMEQAGDELTREHERVYGQWPKAFRIDVAPFADPYGGYTTTGNLRQTVISSRHSGYEGFHSLEMLFHETAHQIDDVLFAAIDRSAKRLGVQAPRDLWHGVLFYTTAELTRRALAKRGVPDFVATSDEVLNRAYRREHHAIATHWGAYIDGKTTMDAAMDAILRTLTTPSASVDVQKVADGVYASIRKEPPGLMFDANSVFLINETDVIVVDTNMTSTSAKANIAELRKLTNKPVRYVINTHWHDDHILGNAAWREAYPGVEFIGHPKTIDDLPTVGKSNREQTLEFGPGFVTEIREKMAKGQNLNGAAITDEERRSYESDIAQAERYFAEARGMEIVLPTITVEDRLTLRRGKRTIDIRFLGRGHSSADLVVHLPEEEIVISGDLIVHPVPLVGTTSYPREFAAALNKLLALRPKTIIPGHGPVMKDDAYVRLMARMLTSIADQTSAAAAKGETLAQARKSVNLDEFRNAIGGNSALLRFIFDFYVAGPAVAAAYNQAKS